MLSFLVLATVRCPPCLYMSQVSKGSEVITGVKMGKYFEDILES